jgi:hypothetical protein
VKSSRWDVERIGYQIEADRVMDEPYICGIKHKDYVDDVGAGGVEIGELLKERTSNRWERNDKIITALP